MESGNLGYAAAIGWVLVILIFGVALVQLKMTRAMAEFERERDEIAACARQAAETDCRGLLVHVVLLVAAAIALTPFSGCCAQPSRAGGSF